MDEKIHIAPVVFETGEHLIHRRNILGVARQHKVRPELLRERLDALAERLALIGECERRAMARKNARDAIGDRMIIRDAHDEAALTLHETG